MNQNRHAASEYPSTVEKHLALGRMWRKRTCPSIGALMRGGEAISRHLEFCEYCRQELECFKKAPDISEILPLMSKWNVTLPEVGQIRQIREEAASCNDGISFKTPMVVVTQLPAAQDEFARVAQMYDEPELRGKGDIAVSFPDGEKFVESWNTYPLLTKYLGPVIGTVGKSVIEQVLANEKRAERETVGNPILKSFRSMEVDIAYHFCKKSVAEIMEKLEEGEVSDSRDKAEIIQFRAAAADARNIHYSRPSLQELAAKWDSHVTELPLAASQAELGPDDSADNILILPCLLSVGDDKRTIPAEVHIHNLSDGFLCTAYCKTQKKPVRVETLISLEDAVPQETTADVLAGGIVRIRARFEAAKPNFDRMRIILILCEGGDSQ